MQASPATPYHLPAVGATRWVARQPGRNGGRAKARPYIIISVLSVFSVLNSSARLTRHCLVFVPLAGIQDQVVESVHVNRLAMQISAVNCLEDSWRIKERSQNDEGEFLPVNHTDKPLAIEVPGPVQVAQLRRIGHNIASGRHSEAGFFTQHRPLCRFYQRGYPVARGAIFRRQEITDPGVAADEKGGRIVEVFPRVAVNAEYVGDALEATIGRQL